MARAGIPGRTKANQSTELAALNALCLKLGQLVKITAGGGAVPAGAATLAEQILQTTELTGLNSTLTSLLNNLVASQDVEILLVRDTGNVIDPTIVVQQIREYDQGTGLWTTSYEKVDGTVYEAPELVGPLEYLDPSAVLNLILTELQSILAQLDVDLSTRASEATLLSVDTHLEKKPDIPTYFFDIANGTVGGLPYPNSLDFAFFTGSLTESITFGPPGIAFNNIDEFVAGFNANVTSIQVLAKSPTEVWVLDGTATAETAIQAGFILNIFGGTASYDSTTWTQANRAEAPTSNLDCILTEAQALAREATLQEVTTDLDCKPSYYFSLDNDSFGGSAPAFPFTVDNFRWEQLPPNPTVINNYPITPTVVNNTTELAALWNDNVPHATLTARDARTLYFLSTDLSPWDFTGQSTIQIAEISVYDVTYTGNAGTPWIKDVSLFTSNLDSIKDTLEGGATATKQDDIITELQNILNEPDYEVIQCYGRDSAIYSPWTITSGSETIGQDVVIVSTQPTVTVPVDLASVNIDQPNSDWWVEVTLDEDFTGVDLIDILFDVEFVAGLAYNDCTIELREAGDTLLDSATGLVLATPGTKGTFNLTYDNSVTNFSSVKLRITPDAFAIGTHETNLDNFMVLGTEVSDPTETIIQRVDRYEDNVLVSTDYLDNEGDPYTLVGTFMKDASLEATSLLSQSLIKIDNNTSEISKLTSHNTFSELLLGNAPFTDVYTNFKELTFTVISGTVDVTVGVGLPITYPVGPVSGTTYTADDISVSSVSIDRTSGTYLVTVKI